MLQFSRQRIRETNLCVTGLPLILLMMGGTPNSSASIRAHKTKFTDESTGLNPQTQSRDLLFVGEAILSHKQRKVVV
jgi:hypothetical protein